MTHSTPRISGITVTESFDWNFLADALPFENSRLWALSPEVRQGFGETIIESWGSIEGDHPHIEIAREFDEACTSLPNWRPTVSHSWNEGAITYTMVSGLASINGLAIESTSVLAIQTIDFAVVANQVVVTTFANNRNRHVQALEQIRSASSTIAEWWYV